MTLLAVAAIEPAIRRRALALLAPTVVALAIIQLGFDYSFSGMVSVLPPPLSGPVQWPLLVTAPLCAFVAAVAMVRRRERADAVE